MESERFIAQALEEIQKGQVDKRHPFRFTALGTVDDRKSAQRMVVVRSCDLLGKTLQIFTDRRSKKVKEITDAAVVSLLFWDAGSKLQIRIQCLAEVLTEQASAQASDGHLKDYNSSKSPGSGIENYAQVEYKETFNTEFFTVIELHIQNMDVLLLGHPEHRRASCTIDQNRQLSESTWLVP
ncbi:MAG: pyridoxamine 5'-phosphate oxidase [Cyclobacteriaceae bacterium]|jgi:pyridoxamine 5'-phosphate oxidase